MTEKAKTQGEIDRLYDLSLEHFGLHHELVTLMEECGELVQAVSKVYRYRDSLARLEDLAEELADVRLMSDKVARAFGIEGRVAHIKEEKLERLEALVKGNDE